MSLSYDLDAGVTVVTDRRGIASTYEHNAAGQRTRHTDGAGAVTTVAYDAEGLPTERTAPLGRTTTYSYL